MDRARNLGSVLASLVDHGSATRRYERGTTLFHQGDPASSVHVVRSGRVAVRLLTEDGDVVTVTIAGPGDVLGELALLTPDGRRSATAEALDAVETTVIDRGVFDDLRARSPDVTDLLLGLMADRVRRLDDQLVEALYVSADVRVLRRLVELAHLYGGIVPLRQEDLAGMAGTTRATVNRVLRRHARAGTLRLDRVRITVLDRPALDRAARPPGGGH